MMYKNKKVGIFGLGISGLSSFNFLKNSAKKIICWDNSETNRNKFEQDYLLPLSDPAWHDLNMIIVSPGVPKSHDVFQLASKHNILISSDIELFIKTNHDSEIIVITGTNGKSTVTALAGHILKQNNLDYHVGGNIGLPVLALSQHAKGYILELSSFQLDLLPSINPTISVLLNLTPDHLDRYSTYEDYCQAKTKALYGDGIKIIGTDSQDSKRIYNKLHDSGNQNLIPIGMKKGISCDDIELSDDFFDRKSYKLLNSNNLRGKHNYENIAATFGICRGLGVSGEDIIKHLPSFVGLEHRMQFIGTHNHISFYNDSKATNLSSAIASLSSLENIFWLAGGIFKEKSLSSLEKHVKNIKKAYLFGESRVLFEDYLKGKIDYQICQTMEEAFNAAINDASLEQKDVNILLAPACSSFDQFANFQDRGNNFINLYNERFQQQ